MDDQDQMQQGSEGWVKVRLGRVTASRISDLMAKTKSGWGAGRRNYMSDLVIEILTGAPIDHFKSKEMERGNEVEPQARSLYSLLRDVDIQEVGFVQHPAIEDAGASPDGLVGDDGMIELKCPNSATHIETLLTEKIPNDYMLQMHWQLACTGRQWVDFVSFDLRLPANLQLFIKRIPRDNAQIIGLEVEVRAFIREMKEQVAALRAKGK